MAAILSIVIPTHQRSDLLERCLASVRRHAPPGVEVIVVDDASPDRQGARVASRFGARIVRRTKRSGFATAVNAGIRASTGDIVELLNDDTEVGENWATAALSWFADKTIAAVAPLVLRWPDGKRIDSAGDQYYLGGIAAKRGHGEPVGPRYSRPTEVFGANASSGFYRRSALDEAGLLAESFGSYFEDVDLAFRLRRLGYRAMFEPASRVLHHVSASFGRTGRQLLERQARNEERVFWRNMPFPALPRALPRHLAVLGAKAWRRWDEGSLTPWLLGKLSLLAGLRAHWRERRVIQELAPSSRPETWLVDNHYWASSDVSLLPGSESRVAP